jgi:hypothetical protein
MAPTPEQTQCTNGGLEIEKLNRVFDARSARPEFIHLFSKSLPRSGHHYLAGILKRLYGNAFEYCEFYQPSTAECCKQQPCLKFCNAGRLGDGFRHVSMQKSHDFKLDDPPYEPTPWLKYVIMVRDYKSAMASEVKLFLIEHFSKFLAEHHIDSREILLHHDKSLYRKALALIDEAGLEPAPQAVESLLHKRYWYHQGFWNKWGTFAGHYPQGAILIDYQDLVSEKRAAVIESLLSMIGFAPEVPLDAALADKPVMTPSEKALEESRTARELIEANRQLLEHFDTTLRKPAIPGHAWRWA